MATQSLIIAICLRKNLNHKFKDRLVKSLLIDYNGENICFTHAEDRKEFFFSTNILKQRVPA